MLVGHLALMLLLTFGQVVSAFAQPVPRIYVGPDLPTEADVLYVDAMFPVGAFVQTHSVTVDGNVVRVTLVQDGGDFSPNPSFSVHEPIGRIAPGQYSVVVTLVTPWRPPDVRTVSKSVGVAMPRATAQAVEFYHRSLDHYFVSADHEEIAYLDAGGHTGWERTGQSFPVLKSASTDTFPVCRAYIKPRFGDSHFFSGFGSECADMRLDGYIADTISDPASSRYIVETSQAFYVALPDTKTGACPPNTLPVFRLWNNRADSNHRYTTSTTVKVTMIAKGYIPEGYGAQAVAMCAPVS